MKQMVIAGNPTNGFTYVGPFDDVYEAQDWAEQNETSESWWIADLLDPATLGAPMVADHRGMWGEISEALDDTMANLDAVDGDDDSDGVPVTCVADLIIKAESQGLDSETEFYAYIWVLVDSGLVNSTGSNQRLVSDFAYSHGEGWKVTAREGFKQLFNGATTVYEAEPWL